MSIANAKLVGSDVELLAAYLTDNPSLPAWQEWLHRLNAIPDKGERLDMGDGYWAHRDGLTAEYGFEPTTSLDQFMSRLAEGKRMVSLQVQTPLVAPKYFHVDSLMADNREYDALDIGCQPDFLATRSGGMQKRTVPREIRHANTRECGGHIHVSLPPPFIDNQELMSQFVRELDDVVYPMAVTGEHADYRSWYRRRAIFRPTPYGVEYRSLGADALFSDNAEAWLSLLFNIVDNVWEA